MYGAIIDARPAFGGRIQVRDAGDLEALVKESEVVSGRPGRLFVIEGACREVYRIACEPYGYWVERIGEESNPACSGYLYPEQLGGHSLGNALREGRLFTRLLRT